VGSAALRQKNFTSFPGLGEKLNASILPVVKREKHTILLRVVMKSKFVKRRRKKEVREAKKKPL